MINAIASSHKLNVCLMNDSFPPVIDGVANAVVNYAKIIQQQLGNAVVATPSYPNVTDEYSFPVLRYKSFATSRRFGYRAGYPFSVTAIEKLKAQNIDIIHTHCPIISTFFARTLRESIDVPIVFTYHTKFDIDIAKLISAEPLRQAAIKLLIGNIEACDEVWVVSNGAGENLRSLGYDGDYTVMENGVDFEKGRSSDQEIASVYSRYALRPDIPIFLFVGRLMWYKGIRIILDGLGAAKARGMQFQMLFVGDGADRTEIEEYTQKLGLSPDCIFVGSVQDRKLLRTYYCCADLFLFPSTFDTNGIVVREAAACGLPSLLISGSSAAEGITDGVTGFLIEENAQALTTAVAEACRDRARLREIGQNAMNDIYISWETSVSKAYLRYGYIIENYLKGVNRHQPVRQDEFFTVMADLCSGIEKARKTRILLK